MIFEPDEYKAKINLQNHGVSFAEAEEIFDDLNGVEFSMKIIPMRKIVFNMSVCRTKDCYL